MMADGSALYESVLCVKSEVHVYRIPPRSTNRGYRAADWKLEEPAWSGRLKITAKGKTAFIKLEDRNSGELFAQAPVDQFPSSIVEAVIDSSRYFVIRIEDGNGRHAFIGIGFADRGDSFDFNVALQDHFKWVKQESDLVHQDSTLDSGPKLDLGFKEGQTIKINIGESGEAAAKSRAAAGALLPPPPTTKSGVLLPPPNTQMMTNPSITGTLFDFGDTAPVSAPPTQELWGEFTAAGSGSAQDSRSGWVQF
ncbi:hypothetical protein DNTS_010301 [Danionella cerebrum]|uniref:NECAP PHear domain-containing protein n=1 Tax=Danionella cerebrum TaxID=2873325 RepID=A0A553MRC3_9TELE|nr:hypothetical protein DNTS_010301 [Danionella translucida]